MHYYYLLNSIFNMVIELVLSGLYLYIYTHLTQINSLCDSCEQIFFRISWINVNTEKILYFRFSSYIYFVPSTHCNR